MIYGTGKDGQSPNRNKAQLVAKLGQSVVAATAFCPAHCLLPAGIEALPAGGLECLSRIEDGMNVLISPDPLCRDSDGGAPDYWPPADPRHQGAGDRRAPDW